MGDPYTRCFEPGDLGPIGTYKINYYAQAGAYHDSASRPSIIPASYAVLII